MSMTIVVAHSLRKKLESSMIPGESEENIVVSEFFDIL